MAQPEIPFISTTDVTSFLASGTNSQVTKTFYDKPYAGVSLFQENLRKRVSAVTYQDLATGTPQQATYYSYDQIGNVKTFWQQLQDLGLKRIDYKYDLVSGKVNRVRYQQGASDLFYYNYQYDAENRLTKASTGIDSVSSDGWEIENPKTDAAYRYYLHGPLARMELGNTDLVQGLDYAYTLQGWLKGVNGNYLTAATDMGRDGVVGGNRAVVARDAYAYSLDYYSGDYRAIGTDQTAVGLTWDLNSGDVMGRNLYNGNISRSTLALSKINAGATVGYSYRYDQLNRLTAMRQHSLANGATKWSTISVGKQFKEDIKYDGNGNIQQYVRYGSGANGKQLQMDSLRYVYDRDGFGYLSGNRLTHILDSIAGDPYTGDISNQQVNNYIYDNIGNLVTNVRDSITNIKWTLYGKIKSITKLDGSSLEYRYDPSGNRVYKAWTHGGIADKTFYIRDAQGNTLAIYGTKDVNSSLYWKEQHLYGSSRLGIWEPSSLVNSDVDSLWNKLGVKRYELVNHLGNVLATISDKPIPEGDHYKAEVLSANDYYPFGMLQPDRSYTLGVYRYGFNGQEKSDEIAGEGNHNTAEFWEYDPRIGRRWNPDEIYKHSPYEAFGSNPIYYADPLGLDSINFNRSVTTFYPGGGRKPTGISTFNVEHISSPGADVFMYNFTSTIVDSKGGATTTTHTLLHPDNSESAVGMTTGKNLIFDGLITTDRKNYDWESIGKVMYSDKEFGRYMISRNSKAADWMSKSSSLEVMETVMPVAVQSGFDAYLSFSAVTINTQKATSLESVFANPNVLKNMTEQDVRAIAESSSGWKVGALGKGKNIGKGLTVRELNPAGTDFTHRYIQYHPGTERHFGSSPYWKISGTKNGSGITRIEL